MKKLWLLLLMVIPLQLVHSQEVKHATNSRVGVGLILNGSDLDQEQFMKVLREQKQHGSAVEFVQLQAEQRDDVLRAAREAQCEFALLLKRKIRTRPVVGLIAQQGGIPNFYNIEIEVAYQLYRVSNEKRFASGSASSVGMSRQNNPNRDAENADPVRQAAKHFAGRVFAEVTKAH